jgi:carboxyl-terminal processing protease
MKVHEMMSTYMRIFLIAIASSITLSFFVESDTFFSQKEQVTLATIKKYLDRYHYNPPKLDSSYSSIVFDNYLKRLDPGRRILTQNDIEAWEQYRWTLAGEVEKSTFHFFDISYATWQRRLKESKEIFEQVIRDVPDFGHMDSLEMDGEKRTFPEDKEELKDAWCRYIKYDMLKRIDNMQERQKNKLELLDEPEEAYKTKIKEDGTERFDSAKWEKDKHFVSLGMDSLTVRAFDKSTSNYEAWFDRMEDTRRVDWMAQYLNALTNTIDPHTGFFKPKDKEDFDMRMSNQLEGIGAQLTKDGEYIKVVRLVPGGPAWEGGELKEDDVIIRVAQDGEEPVDILGMHMDDVISMIRGDKGTTVILTVKGIDGKIRDVAIERDVIIFEENYVKSAALIDSTTMDRVGYIRLPSFYANFDDPSARTSSTDMHAELEKMNSENVESIILDLRNNGGGSLRDVVDIAGQFIESGPVVQVQARRGNPRSLGDDDDESVFSGPVVVLVNHFSASASEILAAALQDYERAVIVGASSTFGKGTVQRFYDLDRYNKNSAFEPLGSVKVTTQKYFRVNGGSVQLKGVVPDIVLPDRYNYVDVGEKDYDHAMAYSRIEPLDAKQNVYTLPNLDKIKKRSNQRISRDTAFQLVDASGLLLKRLKDESTVPLTFEGYDNYKAERDILNEKFDKMKGFSTGLSAEFLESDESYILEDEARTERYEKFVENLKDDIYVAEAFAIIQDMKALQP